MVRKSEFITGIFILAAIAVLVVVAIKPAQKTFGGGDQVTWVADFDNVSLLKDRARVAVSGYDIGQVMKREIVPVEIVDPETGASLGTKVHVRVTMAIDSGFASDCRKGTIARIGAESLLGDKFVEIVPARSGAALPQEGETYLIETEPFGDWMSMLKGMKDDLGTPAKDLLLNLNETVTRLNDQLLSDDESRNLAGIAAKTNDLLARANTTMDTINAELDSPEGLLARARAAADSGANLLGKLDGDYDEIKGRVYTTLGKADDLLDSGNERINRIGEILEEANPKFQNILSTTENRLPELFDELDRTLAEARTMMQGIDQTVRNKDVAGLLYDARVTMQELTLTLQALRADFSQVIWGGPGVAQPAVPDPKNDLKTIQTGKPKRYGY